MEVLLDIYEGGARQQTTNLLALMNDDNDPLWCSDGVEGASLFKHSTRDLAKKSKSTTHRGSPSAIAGAGS